jgi:hypothetical protein
MDESDIDSNTCCVSCEWGICSIDPWIESYHACKSFITGHIIIGGSVSGIERKVEEL